MTTRGMLTGMDPTAFERIVQNDSTAVSLNSTTRAAKGSVLRFSIESGAARFRDFGGDPTPTTGVILQNSVTYEWEGYNNASSLKFIHNTGVSATIINVSKYKASGEGIDA